MDVTCNSLRPLTAQIYRAKHSTRNKVQPKCDCESVCGMASDEKHAMNAIFVMIHLGVFGSLSASSLRTLAVFDFRNVRDKFLGQ